jgi:O-antigen ligase
MHLSNHEWWGLIHGMGFGALFLLAFAGGLAGLYSLRPELVTAAGVTERMRRLRIGVVAMAVAAWGAVITGTWVVYPWYPGEDPHQPKVAAAG